MDRREFIKALEHAPEFSHEELEHISNLSIESQPWQIKCVVAMEEFAELQQEISKKIRGVEDDSFSDLGLLEEMADAYICLDDLTKIFSLRKEVIQAAINVKRQHELIRLQKEAENKG